MADTDAYQADSAVIAALADAQKKLLTMQLNKLAKNSGCRVW